MTNVDTAILIYNDMEELKNDILDGKLTLLNFEVLSVVQI